MGDKKPVTGRAADPTPPLKRTRASYALPPFVAAVSVAGTLFVLRHELEAYKRALIGLLPEPILPGTPLYFVTVKQASTELGVSTASIKRRLRERRLADEAAAKKAAAAAVPATKRAPARRAHLEPV
jgi:hypothetical protein